jgi:ComEC/Rec2-related protein
MKVLCLIFGFLGTVIAATFWEPPLYLLAGLVFLMFVFRDRAWVVFLLIGLVLGGFRTEFFEDRMQVVWLEGQEVQLEGVVIDTRFYERIQRVRFRSGAQTWTADFSKYEAFEEGEVWSVSGRFTPLEPGFEWSRRAVGKVEAFSHHRLHGPPFWTAFLNQSRHRIRDRVNRMVTPPTSSLMLGLVLGSRESFSEELSTAFRVSGLMHLVAISGYNIRLLVVIFFAALGAISFRRRVAVTLVCIVIFVLLVGGGAAVWRAALMGSLSLVVTVAGYRRQAYFALLWSGFFMVMINPYALVYDLGLQLSFLSTWGLMAISPFFDRHLHKVPAVFRESLSLTLASQIATFPILVHAFGTISTVSLFANVAVAPFLPFAFFASALALFLGSPAALVADFFIQIIVRITEFFAAISWAQVPVSFSLLDWLLLALGALILLWKLYKPRLDRAVGRPLEAELSPVPSFLSETHEK